MPPPSQNTASGSSFQMVLANASTEGGSEHRPMSRTAKTPSGEKTEGRTADKGEAGKARSLDSESSDTDAAGEMSGAHGEATADLTKGAASPAAAASQTTQAAVVTSADRSLAVASASSGYVWQSRLGALASDGGSEGSAIKDTDVAEAAGATARVPDKPDRPKAQTESKDVDTQTTAIIAAVDQSKISAANMFSWQGVAHGQGGEASESSAKNAAAGNSTKASGRPVAPPDSVADGDASAAILPDGTTGSDQSLLTQAPEASFEAGLDLLAAPGVSGNSALTANVEGGQAAGKFAPSMPKDASAVDSSANPKAADTVSDAKNAAGGADDTSAHAVAGGVQVSQNAQGDPSKAGAGTTVPRVAENGAAQASMPTLPTHTVSHEGATLQRTAGGAPDAPHEGKAQDLAASAHLAGGETAAASGINTAKVLQTMGETEMHVGMHSEEFGDISIRTSISQQQMLTQISLDHNDLSQALSTHVSTVQAKLGEEYGLHASIEINNQGAPLSGGQGNASQSDQQSPRRSGQAKGFASAVLAESGSSAVAMTSAGDGHGLDIRV